MVIIVTIIVIVAVCGSVILLVAKTALHLFALDGRGGNNDELATETFCSLVREMNEEIIIHDDGASGSFYDKEKTVELIRSRLEEGCRVRCLFNRRNPELLLVKLKRYNNFDLQYMPEPLFRGRPDLHYKIVDRGAKAYLSIHGDGKDREYEFFNCSRYPGLFRKAMFGKQIKEFDELMEVAALKKRLIDERQEVVLS